MWQLLFGFQVIWSCHQSINHQSMFIRRQQPKGFSKRQRLLTEPPCKYMQTFHIHLCPSTSSLPCMHHTSCQARGSHARCQWSTHRPDGSSKPGSHEPHHQWHQSAYQARCTALPPLKQKYVTRINCPGISLVRSISWCECEAWCWLEPDLVDSVFLMFDSAFSPYLQPLLNLHSVLTWLSTFQVWDSNHNFFFSESDSLWSLGWSSALTCDTISYSLTDRWSMRGRRW